MYGLYLFSVWLHILAATAWIGGMFFLVLVVVPWLKKSDKINVGAFLRDTGRSFRTVGWACFAIVTVTGTFNLWVRGVRFSDFARPEWHASPFGKSVMLKLGLFAVVVAMSLIHDFRVGPSATQAMQQDPRSPRTLALRKRASWMGRTTVVFAVLLVAIGVTLVRGWP